MGELSVYRQNHTPVEQNLSYLARIFRRNGICSTTIVISQTSHTSHYQIVVMVILHNCTYPMLYKYLTANYPIHAL